MTFWFVRELEKCVDNRIPQAHYIIFVCEDIQSP